MALKLKIRFVGLSTMVQDGDVTHVILPPTPHDGHHAGAHDATPPHEARLYFGWTNIEGGDYPVPWSVPLARTILRISIAPRPAGAPPLPTDLLDVTALAGSGVARGAIGAAPGADLVHARIDLDLPGEIETLGRVLYRLPDAGGAEENVARDTYTIWTTTIDDGEPTFELVLLDAGRTLRLSPPTFDPADGDVDRLIALMVYHVPAYDLPPNEPTPAIPGTPVLHFPAYYALLDAPTRQPVPVFVEGADPNGRGGSTGTCPKTTGALAPAGD